MLLTKEIEVKLSSATAKYYEELGYSIPMKKSTKSSYKKYKKEFVYDLSKTIIIKVEDLPKGSNVKVKVLCDYCQNETMLVPYFKYLESIKLVNKSACKNCKRKKQDDCNFLKYGVSNTSQLDLVKEKIKNTNIQRYGVDNPIKLLEFRKKMESTMEELYGVKHYSQSQDYKKKFHNTCVEKYGEDYGQQFIEKAFESFYDKTGYKYPSQSPKVREKIIQSLINEYGVDSPSKSLEVREKISKTLYANSSQKASKQQKYICKLYQGTLNFPIKNYNVDICLLNDNLIIEYDGGGIF